jgi:hypothetical protein
MTGRIGALRAAGEVLRLGYRVDYDQLAEHGTQLGALRDEFRGIEDNTAGYEWAVGHDGVADKLATFASNWSDKRDQLAEGLDGLSQCATGAADGYWQVDTDFAANIGGTAT